MQKLKTSGFFYAAIVAGVFGLSNYSLAQQFQPPPTYPASGTSTVPSTLPVQQVPTQPGYLVPAQGRSSTGDLPHVEIKAKGAGDPPQWYKEDVTPAQQYQTARKEAGAAYNQAVTHCRTLAGSERTTCLAEARTTYNEDLATLKQQYGK